jgi:hypothetical protein
MRPQQDRDPSRPPALSSFTRSTRTHTHTHRTLKQPSYVSPFLKCSTPSPFAWSSLNSPTSFEPSGYVSVPLPENQCNDVGMGWDGMGWDGQSIGWVDEWFVMNTIDEAGLRRDMSTHARTHRGACRA